MTEVGYHYSVLTSFSFFYSPAISSSSSSFIFIKSSTDSPSFKPSFSNGHSLKLYSLNHFGFFSSPPVLRPPPLRGDHRHSSIFSTVREQKHLMLQRFQEEQPQIYEAKFKGKALRST